ncbi:hypothetical protein HPB49_019397 [Dermacentor silvarum]|uniref:Uncharacterized protein n=1 Tax=Dermacentor silvarum TaxID=543639 RepID=A0ACB8CZF9_DERSI|nr:hypothetical protein HPB49_019397 [Dermacentor silvarum]
MRTYNMSGHTCVYTQKIDLNETNYKFLQGYKAGDQIVNHTLYAKLGENQTAGPWMVVSQDPGDAIPTIFPNVPAYLSKKLPPKRKTVSSNGGATSKRRKVHSIPKEPQSAENDVPSSSNCNGGYSILEVMTQYDLPNFPHLVKCMRNAVTSKGLLTPEGRVSNKYVKEAWKCDTSSSVTLRAIPHVTMAVSQPNGFEKKRVNLVVTFFSDEDLRGLYVYNSHVEHCYGTHCTKATSAFVSMMRDLIDTMTSRYAK